MKPRTLYAIAFGLGVLAGVGLAVDSYLSIDRAKSRSAVFASDEVQPELTSWYHRKQQEKLTNFIQNNFHK